MASAAPVVAAAAVVVAAAAAVVVVAAATVVVAAAALAPLARGDGIGVEVGTVFLRLKDGHLAPAKNKESEWLAC